MMSNLFWLTEVQMGRLRPFFPKSHGLQRRDAPREYGPPKTLYNRWKRWSDKGIFARMMDGLASKAHRTATSLRSKKGGQAIREVV
jgi:transposase